MRVHSYYVRKLSDLPRDGIQVRIQLHVRRFFCDADECRQRIFTERLPHTAPHYARRTCWLSSSVEQIPYALGGNAGSCLARHLGIQASASTFLLQLRRKALAVRAHGLRVLGIDVWAWRTRHRQGMILCDLEQGKALDLLPERSERNTENWIRRHSGTEIVSSDRARLYAEVDTKAVPQAVPGADCWHLPHNLREALIDALALHHRLLAEVAGETSIPPEVVAAAIPLPANRDKAPRSQRKRIRQQANSERRIARYEAVME